MAVSSYVKSLYLGADSGNVADTAFELVSGSCWFRGIIYNVAAQPDSGLPNKQCVDLHNGDDKDNVVLKLPCGAEHTMAQFLLPDESYIEFPDGIWFSSQVTLIIDNVSFTVFYSQ